ncbi:hypothetical protein [Arsenicicoccus dermatophilus]|uniref:hypothetical protein n=1 Tax=Arsenicicoccus dermatophilus TaxID=1076331 RepID=UPI003916DEF0
MPEPGREAAPVGMVVIVVMVVRVVVTLVVWAPVPGVTGGEVGVPVVGVVAAAHQLSWRR